MPFCPVNRTKKRIVVTGGTGYIGSHLIVELFTSLFRQEEEEREDLEILIVDNLSNSNLKVITRIQSILSHAFPMTHSEEIHFQKKIRFTQLDLCEREQLDAFFAVESVEGIDLVIHLAAAKSVAESIRNPMKYHRNNVEGSRNLIEIMAKYQVYNMLFSSSAAVYGAASEAPFREDVSPVGEKITNPYGQTKFDVETLLNEAAADLKARWNICILRYFNPIGAHPSAQIGEDPCGIPNNLIPYVCQVLVGRRKNLTIFGDDYQTADGTCVRDYIHVVDLAKGHLAAANFLCNNSLGSTRSSNYKSYQNCKNGVQVFNLGTGRGYSVLQVVKAMEIASSKKLPVQVGNRREGDIDSMYADPSNAHKILKWQAERNLQEMCNDAWNFQRKNPNGYE